MFFYRYSLLTIYGANTHVVWKSYSIGFNYNSNSFMVVVRTNVNDQANRNIKKDGK